MFEPSLFSLGRDIPSSSEVLVGTGISDGLQSPSIHIEEQHNQESPLLQTLHSEEEDPIEEPGPVSPVRPRNFQETRKFWTDWRSHQNNLLRADPLSSELMYEEAFENTKFQWLKREKHLEVPQEVNQESRLPKERSYHLDTEDITLADKRDAVLAKIRAASPAEISKFFVLIQQQDKEEWWYRDEEEEFCPGLGGSSSSHENPLYLQLSLSSDQNPPDFPSLDLNLAEEVPEPTIQPPSLLLISPSITGLFLISSFVTFQDLITRFEFIISPKETSGDDVSSWTLIIKPFLYLKITVSPNKLFIYLNNYSLTVGFPNTDQLTQEFGHNFSNQISSLDTKLTYVREVLESFWKKHDINAKGLLSAFRSEANALGKAISKIPTEPSNTLENRITELNELLTQLGLDFSDDDRAAFHNISSEFTIKKELRTILEGLNEIFARITRTLDEVRSPRIENKLDEFKNSVDILRNLQEKHKSSFDTRIDEVVSGQLTSRQVIDKAIRESQDTLHKDFTKVREEIITEQTKLLERSTNYLQTNVNWFILIVVSQILFLIIIVVIVISRWK